MTLYLASLGLATPLGCGKDTVARALFAGSRDGLILDADLIPGRAVRVGAVGATLPEIPAGLERFACRNNRLLLAALDEIGDAIRAAVERYGAARIAVIIGTSTAGIAEGEIALAARRRDGTWPNGFSYTRQETGNPAAFAAAALGLSGPAYTITTACSSSGKVFAAARRLLAAGLCDAAVVGGADSLCRLTLNGFNALEALAADYCNPFSRNRDGINIGEGAAAFLVSREEAPVALLGVGESSDAYHVSAPDPEGRGARRAMEGALANAALDVATIAYINLHGTATPLNDVMEGRAVAALFGAGTACSSTKALTGHTLGAAGAIEAAFLWLSLHPDYAGRLPPHVWDGEPDPAIPELPFVPLGACATLPERTAMLSNSFAFGGSNVAVILGRGW
jgi:3-oxoacyl-[acyl-carrier-protein] synthase-1